MAPSIEVCTYENADFQKAASYVKKIKLRFQEQPSIYHKFKKMIIWCQKCMKNQMYDRTKFWKYFDKNLNANIQGLFQNHADLVQEFVEFYKHFVKAPALSLFENITDEEKNDPACLLDLKIIDVPKNTNTSKLDKTLKTQHSPTKVKNTSYFKKNKSLPEREVKLNPDLNLKDCYVALERIRIAKKDEEGHYFLGSVANEDDIIFSQLDKKAKRTSQNLETYQRPLKKSTIAHCITPLDPVNKKMLLVMFKGLLNLENEEGRCISESLACLADFVEVDGQPRQALSFGILKNRILEGFYNHLDQFQDDLFAVLEIGQNNSCNSSIIKDSERLKEEFTKIRHKLWGEDMSVQLLKSNSQTEKILEHVNNSSNMEVLVEVNKYQQKHPSTDTI